MRTPRDDRSNRYWYRCYIIYSDAYQANDMASWLDDALELALMRVDAIAVECVDFPHITRRGEWQTTQDGVWTGGFWAGLLWLEFEQSKFPASRERAMAFTERLLPRARDTHNHDLGFMFFPSAIKGWELTGDARYHDSAIAAARSLASQFNEAGGFIPGWGFFGAADWSGSVLIDTLMNLPLLVWAARQTGDSKFMHVVRRHAATALKHQLRTDGSVFHMFRFDPATGAAQGGDTYQGLGPDSSWARGQAWAMTGLAILAKMTGDAAYSAASARVADYFYRHLSADGIPPWDFDAMDENSPRDSSAAAIASYGFQKLHEVTREPRHLAAASSLLTDLSNRCANRGKMGGLLLHATADLPHGLGIDESTMYGDYYYLKSLVRFKQNHADA
jgi:unsaturated chondroitin disaccharide hydrolase